MGDENIDKILGTYSLAVQGLHAGVVPFDDALEASRYRAEAVEAINQHIAKAENKWYLAMASEVGYERANSYRDRIDLFDDSGSPIGVKVEVRDYVPDGKAYLLAPKNDKNEKPDVVRLKLPREEGK